MENRIEAIDEILVLDPLEIELRIRRKNSIKSFLFGIILIAVSVLIFFFLKNDEKPKDTDKDDESIEDSEGYIIEDLGNDQILEEKINVNDEKLNEITKDIDPEKKTQKAIIKVIKDDPEIIKPKSTKISSRIVQLKNGLIIGLINDPNIKTSGVAVLTPYGYNIDFIYGFAHFSQHIIYGGSIKYPDNSLFMTKVNNVKGVSNAFTSIDRSIYMFNSPTQEFNELLKIFKYMIYRPNLNKTYIKNQIDVVHSEKLMSNNSDAFFMEMINEISNPTHPLHNGGVGDNISLNSMENIDELALNISLYLRYCLNPNRLKMVIYSDISLDEMQKKVEMFNYKKRLVYNSFINKINQKKYDMINNDLFINNTGKIYYNDRSNSSLISLIFQIKNNTKNHAHINFLNYLIRFKGDNSFLKKFEDILLINSVNLKFIPIGGKQDIFRVTFNFRKDTFNQSDKVIEEFYKFIEYLKGDEISNDYLNEFKNLQEQNFVYQLDKNVNSYSEASKYVQNLMNEDYENFIIGLDLIIKKDEFIAFLNEIKIDNMVIIVNSNNKEILSNKILFDKAPITKTSRHYNITYLDSTMNQDFINTLKSPLKETYSIPNIKKFQTKKTNKDVYPCYENYPSNCNSDEYNNSNTYTPATIKGEGLYTGIYKIDKSFKVPIIVSKLSINFAYIGNDDSKVLFLFKEFLNHNNDFGSLSDYTLNGVSISYTLTTKGIDIQVASFSDLIEEIFDKISQNFVKIPSEKEYQYYLESISNALYSSDSKGRQLSHANEILKIFLSTGIYRKTLDFSKNRYFEYNYNNYTQLLSSLLERISSFTFSIVGDTSRNQVKTILKSLNNTLKPNIYLKKHSISRVVPKKTSVSYLIKSMYPYEIENVVIRDYQFLIANVIDLLKLILFKQCMEMKVFYNDLRENHHLGNSPSFEIINGENDYHLLIIINSARYSPIEIDNFIENTTKIALESPCEGFDKIFNYFFFSNPSVLNLNFRLSQILSEQLQNSLNQMIVNYKEVKQFMNENIKNNPRIINIFLYSALSNDSLNLEVELLNNKKNILTNDLKRYSTIQEDFLKYFSYAPNPNEKFIEPPTPDLIEILYDNSVIKTPLIDKREYEIISLKKSKYNFILINDPNTVESAIAIKSKLGSLNSIFDGFGEFAINSFYCGSENNRNNLKELILNFNGTSYTFSNHQSSDFVFSIYHSQFEKMLDLISDYIFNYKIDNNYIDNEIKVSSSNFYSSNFTKYIFIDILSSNCKNEHPFGKTQSLYFGNKEIFENNRENLTKYLEDYYKLVFKPENIYILLYGNQSILELRTLAQHYFDKELKSPSSDFLNNFTIINKSLDNYIFDQVNLGQIVTLNTNREMGIIEFYFEMTEKNSNILKLLEFYFNGYNKNDLTLKSFLAIRNYGVDVKIYKVNEYLKSDLISIKVDLSNEGINYIDKVIEAVFAGINVAKKNINSIINNFIEIESQKFNLTENFHLNVKNDLIKYIDNYLKFGPTNLLGAFENNDLQNECVQYLNNMSPNKVFILIDSNISISSSYINNQSEKITNSYKIKYQINKISEDNLNKLSQIERVDEETIKTRSVNDNYSSLKSTSVKPCYLQSPYKCINEEHDPSKSKKYDLYIIKDQYNIYSSFKTDRSFNLPFIKGLIQIEFNYNMIRQLVNDTHSYALLHLYFDSFNFLFKQLNWEETGNKIKYSEKISDKIQISFSTYNDLFTKMNDNIFSFLQTPIEENYFNILKQRYVLKKSNNKDNSYKEYYEEMIKIFNQFITANSTKFELFSIDDILNCQYSEFNSFFTVLNQYKEKLLYLSLGDISYDEAYSESNKLYQLINFNNSDIYNYNSSNIYYVKLPELSSFIYYTKTKEDNNKNNRILVSYEISSDFIDIYKIYILCVQQKIYHYMRNIKGSVYDIQLKIEKVEKYYYFIIYAISPIDNPELLEKYINEALNQTLQNSSKCENIDLISEYLIKGKRKNYTSDDKLEELINKVKGIQTETNSNINKKIIYESIINRVRNDIINLCKRIVILNYRSDISENEINESIKLIPKNYTLNPNVRNNVTNNIKELEHLTYF